MKIDLLVMSVKKEFFWFTRTKKAWMIQCYMFVLPLIMRLDPQSFSAISENKIYLLLVGVIGVTGQYMLDSVYKDVARKVNSFYFNLNIPIIYNVLSKVILCFILSFISITYSLILWSEFIEIAELILLIFTFFNTIFIFYFGVNFLYNPNSLFSPCYLTAGVLIIIVAIMYFLDVIFLQILFQLILIPISIFLFRNLYKFKRIRLRTL